jgi:hypothetical protein
MSLRSCFRVENSKMRLRQSIGHSANPTRGTSVEEGWTVRIGATNNFNSPGIPLIQHWNSIQVT